MANSESTVSPPTSPKPSLSATKVEQSTLSSEENDGKRPHSEEDVEHHDEPHDVLTTPASPPPHAKTMNVPIPTAITVFSADSPYSEVVSLPPTSPPANGITDASFAAASSSRASPVTISGNDHSHSYGFTMHSPGHSPSHSPRTPSYMQEGTGSSQAQRQTHSKHRSSVSTDLDAQEMVISSLRQQIMDLSTQVSQLNSKLITSYDRVSDLEDSLHVSTTQLHSSKTKIQELEVERGQHLAALNTGLLVEKSHVTTELTRLMDKATEEAAQRGRAESARHAIEKDLDDLSAQLFGQANTMVAEARFARHQSERKVEEAEKALKGAEDAVRVMQAQMQTMLEEKEKEEKEREQERERDNGWGVVGRRAPMGAAAKEVKLLRIHTPYQDYMGFIAHLRLLHLSTQNPPAMATLLPLPFLARLLTEDSEPTVRLDLAPSLNWLSRRSVLSAIHSGQLRIEPISISSLLTDPNTNINPDNVSCALCGCALFPSSASDLPGHGLGHQHTSSNASTASSWSTAGAAKFFRKPSLQLGLAQSSPSSPTATPSVPPFISAQGRRTSTSAASLLENQANAQVFIFRLSTSSSTNAGTANLPVPKSISASSSSSTAGPSSTTSSYSPFPLSSISLSLPSSSSPASNIPPTSSHQHTSSLSQSTSTIYPLCTASWCLARLRTTCILWAFIRTGVVEKVWEEELPEPAPLSAGLNNPGTGPVGGGSNKMERSKSATTTPQANTNGSSQPPPVPPRRRGLWSLASAIGERAVSWGDKDKKSEKAEEQATPTETPRAPSKDLPSAPVPRRVPPPSAESTTAPSTTPSAPSVEAVAHIPTTAPPALNTSTPAPSAPPPIPPRRADRPQAPTPPLRSPIRSTPPLRVVSPPPRSPVRPSSPLATHPPKSAHVRGTSLSTAIGVPLPPSRPGTPAQTPAIGGVAGASISRPTTPQAPGRTGSPAPGGSPAPPPIPRRAAARSRVAAVAEEETKVEEKVQETATTVESVTVTEGAEKEKEEKDGVIELSDSEDDDDKASVTTAPDEVTTPTAAETSTGGDKNAFDDDKEQKPVESKVEVEEAKDVPQPKPDQPNAETEKSVEEKPNDPAQAQEIVSTEPHSIKSNANIAEEEEEVNPNYTSDITWEERTWREIVRLREDMFWARVGGIRE